MVQNSNAVYINTSSALDSGVYGNSVLDKKVNDIITIQTYKNGKFEDVTDEWNIVEHDSAYGEKLAYKLDANFVPTEEYYVVYETLPEENNSGVFLASLEFVDSVNAVLSSLAETNAAQSAEIALLKELIMELVSNGADKDIKFEYDDNGNLKNISTK